MRFKLPCRSLPAPLSSLLLVALIGLAAACSTPRPPIAETSPEILWDTWGVPHIFADDGAGLFYAFGWAQAHSHADLVLRLYGESRGRAAEYWGEQELEQDRWVWTAGIPARAEAWLDQQDPEMRSFLDAFAAGFNDYATGHLEEIADEVEVVLPVSATDLLAHTQRILHFTFVVSRGEIAGSRQQFEAGSNAWAVGPRRSASGNTLLVANPHLPWTDFFTWFEAQWTGPGINAYGAALVGSPLLTTAFNDSLGWTHTVNTHDGYDLFELALEGDGYRFDGEVRPFDSEEVTLRVRQDDGSLTSETFEVLRSHQGPIVARNGAKALALSVVGLDAAHITRQYWDMARADNLASFEAAIRGTQVPMFTFMYADRDGNILHHFGGETPIRPRGDWATWSQPVPGDSSAWSWTGIHPFDDLPTIRNPESGWLQNANDPPWTTTFPRAIEPGDFPPYMAPRFMHFRAQRSARMLAEDDSLTFDEIVGYKFSTRMELADRLLDDLEQAVAEHGDAEAREAMAVLSTWDRSADAGSRGAVLFARFAAEMSQAGQSLRTPLPASGFARPWISTEPRTTPDGFAEPATAAAALSGAAAAVERQHGSLDIEWGAVYRVRRNGHDYPGNGGPGTLGIFRVVNFSADDDGTQEAVSGDSWVAIVEFGEPLRAEVLLSYGNATQPGSPHNGDQLELFSQKRLRHAWRTRPEIEAHLEAREQLERR